MRWVDIHIINVHRWLIALLLVFVSMGTAVAVDPNKEQDKELLKGARWSVSTNLLYWAALAPNAGIEYSISPKWSLSLNGFCPWWRKDVEHKYYQLANIEPGVKFYLNTKRGLRTGHHFSLYGQAGLYDLENGSPGYKGEYGAVGIGYGYTIPVGRSLSVNFEIGGGILITEFEKYEPQEDCYAYLSTERIQYVGLTRAEVSLVWRIGNKGGKK